MRCDLCGQDPCSDYLDASTPVLDDTPPSERMYNVRAEVSENGRLIYAPGARIPLQEAVLRDLPGAKRQATR